MTLTAPPDAVDSGNRSGSGCAGGCVPKFYGKQIENLILMQPESRKVGNKSHHHRLQLHPGQRERSRGRIYLDFN